MSATTQFTRFTGPRMTRMSGEGIELEDKKLDRCDIPGHGISVLPTSRVLSTSIIDRTEVSGGRRVAVWRVLAESQLLDRAARRLDLFNVWCPSSDPQLLEPELRDAWWPCSEPQLPDRAEHRPDLRDAWCSPSELQLLHSADLRVLSRAVRQSAERVRTGIRLRPPPTVPPAGRIGGSVVRKGSTGGPRHSAGPAVEAGDRH